MKKTSHSGQLVLSFYKTWNCALQYSQVWPSICSYIFFLPSIKQILQNLQNYNRNFPNRKFDAINGLKYLNNIMIINVECLPEWNGKRVGFTITRSNQESSISRNPAKQFFCFGSACSRMIPLLTLMITRLRYRLVQNNAETLADAK